MREDTIKIKCEFDVLEMLFDCVSAGMTRSGSVYPIEISNEILQKAVSNTVDYLIKHIEVVDRKTENCSEIPTSSEPQTCSFSDCDNFKNPDYARCIECERKQIESNHR